MARLPLAKVRVRVDCVQGGQRPMNFQKGGSLDVVCSTERKKSGSTLSLGRKEALGGPDTTEGALGGHQVRISSISFQRGSLANELGSLTSEL